MRRQGRKRQGKWNRPLGYAARDAYLRELGFESYRAYLDSDLWEDIRSRVLVKTRRCFVCRRAKKATQVHHMIYTEENLSGRSLRGLKPVCRGCHFNIEFDAEGNKLDIDEARKKAKRLRASRRYPRQVRRVARQTARRWAEFGRVMERDD